MKIFLCFIFLFSFNGYLVLCLDDSQAAEYYWLGQTTRSVSNTDYKYHQADHIQRPCSNIDCIRRYFAHNFMCSPVHGPAPDPFILKYLPLELTHCNVTLTLINAHIRGLNSGKILEFYINKKTDTLVLEVGFDKLAVDTPVTVATYHRKGKEPIELTADSIIVFKRFSLTLTIKNFSDLNHARPHVYTYFSDPDPPITVGYGITGSKDSMVIRRNRKWVDEIILSAKEAFIVQGPVYMSAYMNSMICNSKYI